MRAIARLDEDNLVLVCIIQRERRIDFDTEVVNPSIAFEF